MTDPAQMTFPDDYEEFVEDLVDGPEAAAVLITSSDDHTDVFGELGEGRDPRFLALWMLGAHIVHVTETARESGGVATMESVVAEAINLVREYGE